MNSTEHHQALLDLATQFRHVTAGALQNTQQHLPYEAMRLLADKLPTGDRLVMIHLGLDGNSMAYGFSFVRGTPSDDGLDYVDPGAPAHLLTDGELVPISLEEWQPLHEAYREYVLVDRGDGHGFVPLGENDARAVVLAWDTEIDEMYRMTVQGESGPFRLMLSSVSVRHDTSDGGPAGFRHGVAFHVEEEREPDWVPLLDDIDHLVGPFRFKSSDYGNLCPPRCARFVR